MKKLGVALSAMALAVMMHASTAFANPTCVLLKFEDDTRFDRIETTNTLSDLILEKLINTGKFNFKESKPIDAKLEKRLYDERAQEIENLQWALRYGNYNKLFEGPGFNEKKAQSIATAKLGQIVSPEITNEIGYQHSAEYLIQGTIINLGSGSWTDNNISNIANTAINTIQSFNANGAANFLGPLGMIASIVGIEKNVMGVQADLRVIRSNTGEVVWQKRVTGLDVTKQISVGGLVKVGTLKLSNEMYFKAVDDAATKIANTLVADLDANKLFVK